MDPQHESLLNAEDDDDEPLREHHPSPSAIQLSPRLILSVDPNDLEKQQASLCGLVRLIKLRWRRFAQDDQKLLVSLGVMVCMCVVLTTIAVLGFTSKSIHHADENNNPVWTAQRLQVWLDYAREIQSTRSGRFDDHQQCKSLYDASCGALSSANNDNNTAYLGAFQDLHTKIQDSLGQIADEGWPLLGSWYCTCMNQTGRKLWGLSELEQLLTAIRQVSNVQTLTTAVAQLHLSGVDVLFGISVGSDLMDLNRRSLYMDAPSPQYSNSTALRTALTQWMDSGALEQALQFEQQQLLPYILTAAQFRQGVKSLAVYNPVLMDGQYLSLGSQDLFNWPQYFQMMGLGVGLGSSQNFLILLQPSYQRQLNRALLQLSSRNNWAPLRGYLMYRLLAGYYSALPVGSGQSVQADDCLASLEESLGYLLGRYYVSEYIADSQETKQQVNHMVEAVVREFEERLSYGAYDQWMDNVTRQGALQKLEALVPMIAYPDQWGTEDMPDYYIDDSRGDHLGNVLRSRQDAIKKNLASWFLGNNDRYHWLMEAYQVNAYYWAGTIVFPAGILQGAFFNPLAPLEINYGGIGVVIGHEVAHAFDDQGSMYDWRGLRRDWWSNSSSVAFDSKEQCVQSLYSQQQTPYGPIDGALTLGENMADISGLSLALGAYERDFYEQYGHSSSLTKQYEDRLKHLYGVKNRHQLFYEAFAHAWCSLIPPALAQSRLASDPHSPPRWRVDVATAQQPEFYRAFGCSVAKGSRLCSVF